MAVAAQALGPPQTKPGLDLRDRDFLSAADLSAEELEGILDRSVALKSGTHRLAEQGVLKHSAAEHDSRDAGRLPQLRANLSDDRHQSVVEAPSDDGHIQLSVSVEIRDCYRRNGGKTLLEQGIRLADKEQTSLEEVMRVAYFE